MFGSPESIASGIRQGAPAWAAKLFGYFCLANVAVGSVILVFDFWASYQGAGLFLMGMLGGGLLADVSAVAVSFAPQLIQITFWLAMSVHHTLVSDKKVLAFAIAMLVLDTWLDTRYLVTVKYMSLAEAIAWVILVQGLLSEVLIGTFAPYGLAVLRPRSGPRTRSPNRPRPAADMLKMMGDS